MTTNHGHKKQSNIPRNLAIIVFVLLAVVGYFLSKPPPEEEPAPETTSDTEMSVTTGAVDIMSIPAPRVYADYESQRQFTALFKTLMPAFAPPVLGKPIRIVKTDGEVIDGELLRFTPTGVVLSTPDGMVNVSRKEMDDSSREKLFVDDFGRVVATEKIDATTADLSQSSLRELLLPMESTNVLEIRRFTAESFTARYGPGLHFAEVPGSELLRGQKVYVAGESNAWIYVINPAAGSAYGWIPKFVSFTMSPDDKAIISKEVKELTDSGFLISVEPEKNHALVDIHEWLITEPATREGKCRLLAIYCGQQRNSRLFWVDIHGSPNNKLLAEYSASKGFKVH